MHTLLFEVQPRAGHEDHYFAHATRLRPLLDAHPGLLFIDRFKSLVRPNIILSHSHWQDEASLARWRTDAQHRRSQAAGRNQHFEDYRIRISRVVTHYVRGEPPGARALDRISFWWKQLVLPPKAVNPIDSKEIDQFYILCRHRNTIPTKDELI